MGRGSRLAESTPRLVEGLKHGRVVGVACGDFHSLALTSRDEVFTWGGGSFGELGHDDHEHRALPRRVEALCGRRLSFAACGAAHNIVLAQP